MASKFSVDLKDVKSAPKGDIKQLADTKQWSQIKSHVEFRKDDEEAWVWLRLDGNTALAQAAQESDWRNHLGWVAVVGFRYYSGMKKRPTRQTQVKVELISFYTRAQTDKNFAEALKNVATPTERLTLMGLGKSALCFALKYLIQIGYLQMTDTIIGLIAGQTVTSNDRIQLIRYYEKLGFHLVVKNMEKGTSVKYKPGEYTVWEYAEHYAVAHVATLLGQGCQNPNRVFAAATASTSFV